MKTLGDRVMKEINTKELPETSELCTNFDRYIDTSVAAQLKDNPGKMVAGYPGWDFNALVYFLDDKYHAEVKVFGRVRGVISEDSVEELMDSVSSQYGYD